MTHAVLIQNRVAAMTVDAYNRSAIAGIDLDNGNVFRLDSLNSSTGCEVWDATPPTTSASTLDNLWMAYSPEVVITTSGTKQYKGLDPDPLSFTNTGSLVFDAFKPQIGDVITLTADAFTAAKSTNTYASSGSEGHTLFWNSSATTAAFACQLMDITYISVGSGSTLAETQRQTAYKMVVVNN